MKFRRIRRVMSVLIGALSLCACCCGGGADVIGSDIGADSQPSMQYTSTDFTVDDYSQSAVLGSP